MPGGIKSNNYETMIRDEGANVKFFHMDTKTLLIINCAATRGVSRPFCGKGSGGRESRCLRKVPPVQFVEKVVMDGRIVYTSAVDGEPCVSERCLPSNLWKR
jgi:hypothetical protein